MSTGEFVKRACIVAALFFLPLLIWKLFDLVLMGTGAILVAVGLRLGAEPFARWLRLPQPLALICSGLIVVGCLTGVGYLFGTQIGFELQDVLRRADSALQTIMSTLQGSQLGKILLSHFAGGSFSIADLISSIFAVSTVFLEGVIVMVFAGVYLAAQPSLYRNGFVRLFPVAWRPSAAETVDHLAHALRHWLLGQLLQMLLIGLLSTIAVWVVGLPAPFALGLIAGLAEFVPYLGPILASIPAILVATSVSFQAVLWTIVAYLIIHQAEGNLIAPLIQRQMVYVPPVVMLLGVVAMTFVFGGIGIFFAAPIVVILFVAVNKLYIQDSLGEATVFPGERTKSH